MNSKMIKTPCGLPEFPVDALSYAAMIPPLCWTPLGICLESYESLLVALIITSFLEVLTQ